MLVYEYMQKVAWMHIFPEDFNAKLSDFRLAKFGSDGAKGQISTRVFGTRDSLTLKTDVYSFGVVLLEIFRLWCSQKCTDGQTGNLVQWAKPHLRNTEQLHHVIDKKLDGHIPMVEAEKLAKIILRCP
ncbi:hypothetical protein K2173_006387 [Erythroxylum novogranatense]|uniref:Uncharacterized protein n=1 Tax=Erythroxylum novogranatense TaxID=1862640 RepID=A0AAV8U361_9ROSI|nr:hypothetical protein K2173_006387 [Erythroxylum novogranatense]